MKKDTRTPFVAALLSMVALSSCEDAGNDKTTGSTPSRPEIDAVFLDAEPEGAVSVLEARKVAQPGANIAVVGRVAGTLKPFSEEYATLALADNSLETCERVPGDSCETPWDACCVEPAVIAASRLTAQVLGADGRPVEQSLKGVHGLAELDALVVTGAVAENSTPENLILNVTGFFLKK